MNNKKDLRKLYRSVRNNISKPEKQKFDSEICLRFINSEFVKKYDIFLIYLSVNDEIDTYSLIDYLFKSKKIVAVPFCKDKEMKFCKINSFKELEEGLYGIPTAKNPVFLSFEEIKGSLCIVPALCIDYNGNRLGYGGGYYDRFLAENNVVTVAFCYERCMVETLPSEPFDKPVNYVVTENKLKKLYYKEVSTYE